jgi:hypothetical protein
MDKYFAMFEKYFLNNIRKTVLTDPSYSRFQHMFENYPYIDKNDFPALEDQYIFFQTDELKQELCNDYLPYKIKDLGEDYHRALGGLLMYPPCCIEYFVSKEREQQDRRIFLLYYGMTCGVSMRDLDKAASYLWNLIPNPVDDTMVFKDNETYIEIPYRDLELIRRLQLLSAAS